MKMNRWNWKRRTDRAGEAGQTTVFFVLILGIFLLGGLCLAFDLANMWFHRQAAQTAADAACTAGAMDLLVDAEGSPTGHQGFTLGTPYSCTTTSTDSVCQYAAKNGYNSSNTAPGNLVSVSFPAGVNGVTTPPAGVAPTPFIRVDVLEHVGTFFVGMLSGGTTADVRAFATCGVEQAQAPIPLVVLDPRFADTKTFQVGGNSTLAIYGGPQQSIQVNSSNPNSAYIQGLVDLHQGGPVTPNPTGSDLGTWGGPTTQPGLSDFDPGTTGHWLAPHFPVNDPFAQVPAPTLPTQTYTTWTDTILPGNDECPNVTTIKECHRYYPGYYTAGITAKGQGGSNLALSLFVPGIYYVVGGFSADSNSCIRPSTLQGDGSGGVMFYLADAVSVSVAANSGDKCFDKNKGTPNVPVFNTSSGTGSLLYGAKCTLASTTPNNLPAGTTLTGTVLLGPCRAGTITPYCDTNCGVNYGDPQGTSDPLGEQRGFLFFQNRAVNAGTNPNWQGGGQFLLAGTMYFHQCVTSGSDTGLSCSTTSAYNDNLTLAGNPGSSTYILGDIIVDQLTLKGSATLTMDLNPQTSFTVLKASLFQ